MLTGGKIILIEIFELFFTRAFHSKFSASFSYSFKRGKFEVRAHNIIVFNTENIEEGPEGENNIIF